jgi:hypothetical protein
MSEGHPIFGPEFSLGATLHDSDLNFSFQVWTRGISLSQQEAEKIFVTWRRQSRKNKPVRNQVVAIQWIGDLLR